MWLLYICLPIPHSFGAAVSRRQGLGTKSEATGMTKLTTTLDIRSSPHIRSGTSVDSIMFNVVLALLPVTVFAIYSFGLAALLTLTTAVLTCVAAEFALCRLNQKQVTVGDWSVVVTGLLYGLTLPPSLPLWMTVSAI